MKIFTKRLEILGLCIALVLGTTCYQASAHVLWLQVRDYTGCNTKKLQHEKIYQF